MNRSQRIVLFVYVGLIAVMTLFPPYHASGNAGRVKFSMKPSYGYLFSPTSLDESQMHCYINVSKLMIQYLGVTLICGGLLLAFKEK